MGEALREGARKASGGGGAPQRPREGVQSPRFQREGGFELGGAGSTPLKGMGMRIPSMSQVLDNYAASHASYANLIAAERGGEEGVRERQGYMNTPLKVLKGELIELINDLLEELDNVHAQVADQSLTHVHADDVILTFGSSATVLEFLREAAKKKKSFSVFVSEGHPLNEGHTMARDLAKARVETTLISDAAVWAVMARVHKVVVGTHAVMADGGCLAPVGSHMVALAAKAHGVPYIVCTGLHKLSPVFHQEGDTLDGHRGPDPSAELGDYMMMRNLISVPSPGFDYVPPDLITLFITEQGAHAPSYIYRLLLELYSTEDI